jgi:hypothetical protein
MPDQKVAEALRWICEIFGSVEAHYQAVGGLAARAYGAVRPLVDLDFYVRAEDLSRILERVGDACVWGPEHFEDGNWDLTFAKVEKHGVQIEIAEAEGARYFSPGSGEWLDQNIEFHASEKRVVLGVEVQVMPRAQLIAYKRALNRSVDRLDLEEIADQE